MAASGGHHGPRHAVAARGVASCALPLGGESDRGRRGHGHTVFIVDITPPTSFELQLMVREELSRTKEDGTLMYPHLQKFMPPVPSRFVQTRESTQAAISDTYNGDGKVYSALRAAAYVSWGIVTSLGAPSETGLRA